VVVVEAENGVNIGGASLKDMINKWWPGPADQGRWTDTLERFYAENAAYHAMTSGGDKSGHPQVRYLMERIRKDRVYVEIGCGGGLVSGLVAGTGASVFGFDISPIAVGNANGKYGSGGAQFNVASADAVPLADASVDGAWSFEVLEHLWNPVAALREMARVVKPGGFIFVTCPNHFSLDLHLRKRVMIRTAEMGCAMLRFVHDKCGRRNYVNLVPDIVRDDVYPDCDMVSSLIPCKLPKLAAELKCRIDRLSMFAMCAGNDATDAARLVQYDRVPLVRWFGDHVFLWMVKAT
jgi:SAM-dependent methyltransferase